MKPFKINRDSWHYKLNKYFFNESEHWMERSWEPRHSDFCSYWRATVFRLLLAGFMIFSILAFLFFIGGAIYSEPVQSLVVVLVIVSFIAMLVLVAWLTEKMKSRKNSNYDKPQSLFMQKYRAHKSKICPMVEYD
jgi:Flp pilus assembly protein TadB